MCALCNKVSVTLSIPSLWQVGSIDADINHLKIYLYTYLEHRKQFLNTGIKMQSWQFVLLVLRYKNPATFIQPKYQKFKSDM